MAIRAVKAFVRDEYEEEKFRQVNTDLMETSQQTFHYAVLNMPAFQLTMYSTTVLILWFGGRMIMAGTLQVGELTGFLSYVLQVMNSLMMISNVFLLLTRSLASAQRIGEVLKSARASAPQPTGSQRCGTASVVFENVLSNTIPTPKNTRCPASAFPFSRGRPWGDRRNGLGEDHAGIS